MSLEKPTLYWVDDEVNAEMYESSREIFTNYFKVSFLETIDELEEKLKNETLPDIVILDIIFGDKPDVGLNYLKKVSEDKDNKLKYVVLTADSYLPHLEQIIKITEKNNERMRFFEKLTSAKQLSEDIMDWLEQK